MEKKAYLAAPFFSQKEREIYQKVISYLREVEGFELYVPAEHFIDGAWNMSNGKWARAVFEEDVRAIDEAEYVFVINHGMYSDSGTAWETGYAYAKGKRVCMVVTSEDYHKDFSLMMMNGCSAIINIEYPDSALPTDLFNQK